MGVLCIVSASSRVSFCLFRKYSVYILIEIPIRLSNSLYTNSFIFADVNVDVENAMYSDLVICNDFINYKVLSAFDFLFIGFDLSQLLQTDITSERKCSNDYCFSLALFIFPIMSASVFLRNKYKRVKAFFRYIIFLLSITKSSLLTKNDMLKPTSEIFTYESIHACNLFHTSHLHNDFAFLVPSTFKYRNKGSFFKLRLLLSGDRIFLYESTFR